jgi:hypothetical protein
LRYTENGSQSSAGVSWSEDNDSDQMDDSNDEDEATLQTAEITVDSDEENQTRRFASSQPGNLISITNEVSSLPAFPQSNTTSLSSDQFEYRSEI